MLLIRRIVVGVATAGMGVALAIGPATAAFADGPDTSKRTIQQIQGQPWVELEQGHESYRVNVVQCVLEQYKYFKGCDTDAIGGAYYSADLTAAVKKYQAAKDLPVNGKVDAETWGALRDQVGLVKPGDKRTDVVKVLQYTLNVLGSYDLTVDGQYGAATKTAVSAFQKSKKIDPDGIVGPITFRALYCEGAEA